MPHIRCLLGHAWDEWTLYWENFVGGEVRRKRRCANCRQEQHEHVHFGRPDWVGEGAARAGAGEDRRVGE